MISLLSPRREAVLVAAALAALGLTELGVAARPAAALPGLDLSAGLYGAYDLNATSGSAFGADLDAYVGTPILKVSGHLLTVSGQTIGEASLRFEPLPLPVLALRPGIGYQGRQASGGTLDHALYPSLAIGIAIPLVPVSADLEVGAGIPTTLQPLLSYSGNVNIFPIPLLPVAISARYRAYQGMSTGSGAMLSVVEGGLRVAL
ncbi:MAG: hypothetical protein FJZ01_11585 [Candidatus Sericytochromatia bacterium]|nr:hypothetical protein [Candidatus Tanganyikabacteria bacterium]